MTVNSCWQSTACQLFNTGLTLSNMLNSWTRHGPTEGVFHLRRPSSWMGAVPCSAGTQMPFSHGSTSFPLAAHGSNCPILQDGCSSMTTSADRLRKMVKHMQGTGPWLLGAHLSDLVSPAAQELLLRSDPGYIALCPYSVCCPSQSLSKSLDLCVRLQVSVQ